MLDAECDSAGEGLQPRSPHQPCWLRRRVLTLVTVLAVGAAVASVALPPTRLLEVLTRPHRYLTPPGRWSTQLVDTSKRGSPKRPRFLRIPAGTCADEWQPIITERACQTAAMDLSLHTKPPLKTYSTRPSGCYFIQNEEEDHGTLWLTTHSDDVENTFDAKTGWVPEAVCERHGMSETRGPESAGAAESREDETVCQYVVGAFGSATCPENAERLDESECRDMPYHFGGVLHVPFSFNSEWDPPGCFFFGTEYYYNKHRTGSGRDSRKVYCKRCQALPAAVSDWSEWGNDSPQTLALARQASARFRKISSGKCSDMGWYAIHDQAACEEAAKYLALMDITAQSTGLEERPDGCYYFRNYEDGTETLWLDTNPMSRGNGAETSDFIKGSLRQPICAKLPIAGSAAAAPSPPKEHKALTHNSAFRLIRMGRCMDMQLEPILEFSVCQFAATELGLADITPKMTDLPDSPEGCYYFWNNEDLTHTLWLNSSPLSRGNGAQETSHPSRGLRQPLCAAHTLPGLAAVE